jgi:hypothetical protein
MIQSLKPESEVLPGRLSTFEDLTCLICGVVSCQTHGEYTKDAIFYDEESDEEHEDGRLIQFEYNLRALSMKHEHILRIHNVRLKDQDARESQSSSRVSPCSETCYKNWNLEDCESWTRQEVNIDALQEMLISVRDKDHQSCTISTAMGWPCWQVHREIVKNGKRRRISSESPINRHRTLDRPSWYNNSTKTLNKWEDSQVHAHEKREEFVPVRYQQYSPHTFNSIVYIILLTILVCPRWPMSARMPLSRF